MANESFIIPIQDQNSKKFNIAELMEQSKTN